MELLSFQLNVQLLLLFLPLLLTDRMSPERNMDKVHMNRVSAQVIKPL